MRATASSEPGRSRAQSSRTEYSCKPIGILAMAFLSSGVRLREDHPRRTRRPQGGWTAVSIVPAGREKAKFFCTNARKGDSAKGKGKGESRRWPDHSPYPSPSLSGFALSPFRPFLQKRVLSVIN